MLFAFIVAVPFGYYFSKQWLEGFEYRTSIGFELYALAGAITFIIGALTVGFRSLQAARANPIERLRDE